ncbi:MAG TPA: cyclodeaminase/cyclohydrolase family protein [Ktedonobacterales bacterium]|nr:cyclodeaminase/cyclohydrolase family protein [Ktedonobacterales bacterium]
MQQETLGNFLDQLASSAPTPGGGSVAALCGALSGALGSMVANLTLGREKYQDVEPAIREALEQSERLRAEFTQLINDDISAYGTLSAAYKLPKATPDEQAKRSAQIQETLKGAAEAPLRIAERARQALDLCRTLGEIGNTNVISDVGVAAITAHAALESAELNVLINLKAIKDQTLASALLQRLNAARGGAAPMTQDILATVREKMGV